MTPEPNEFDRDEQDQSEIFDEDNLEPADAGAPSAERRTFEEIPDVLDVTSAVGDADDDAALIGEELDDDEIIDLEADADMADREDDELDPRLPEAPGDEPPLLAEEAGIDEADRATGDAAPAGDVDLLYSGDLTHSAEGQANPAALESEELADDDVAALGYEGGQPIERPLQPVRLEIGLRNGLWALTRDGEPLRDYGHLERAVHEAGEIAKELRRSGEPAVIHLHPKEGKTIEITEDTPPPRRAPEEHSAVVPDRSADG